VKQVRGSTAFALPEERDGVVLERIENQRLAIVATEFSGLRFAAEPEDAIDEDDELDGDDWYDRDSLRTFRRSDYDGNFDDFDPEDFAAIYDPDEFDDWSD
jgi:hypothetical protein